MDDKELLAGRINELSTKAYMNSYVTHTNFLSQSELANFYEILRIKGISSNSRSINGSQYLIYGGKSDFDRAVVCFLPDYLDEEGFLLQEKENPEIISCIHVTPVNAKFADELNHRDYLGSLMNLGIERDLTGDIIATDKEAYIYVLKSIAELICKELVRIKHTTVKCEEINPKDCDVEPEFEEITGSVASERTDAILAFVYRLSRSDSQKLIEAEKVFIDGRTAVSGGYTLKTGSRVSVRGYGKFIYMGTEKETRKGRLFVRVKIYK